MKAEGFFMSAPPAPNQQAQGEELYWIIPVSGQVRHNTKVQTSKSYNFKCFLKRLQITIPA